MRGGARGAASSVGAWRQAAGERVGLGLLLLVGLPGLLHFIGRHGIEAIGRRGNEGGQGAFSLGEGEAQGIAAGGLGGGNAREAMLMGGGQGAVAGGLVGK